MIERNIPIGHADGEDSELPFVVTADWGYLRLRKPGYDKRALNKWLKEIARAGWKEALVFFKHEDAGAEPETALKFLRLSGEEVRIESG